MNTRDKIIPLRVIAVHPKKQSIKSEIRTAITTKKMMVFFLSDLNRSAEYLAIKRADNPEIIRIANQGIIILMLPDTTGVISGGIGLIIEIINVIPLR